MEKRRSMTKLVKSTLENTDRLRKRQKRHPPTEAEAIELFLQHKSAAPIYICTCCHRQMYFESVSVFIRDKYVVSDDFIAECTTVLHSVDNKEWICKTCSGHFKKRMTPAQGVFNKM